MLINQYSLLFFFNDAATTEIYTLSLHDALPISPRRRPPRAGPSPARSTARELPGRRQSARAASAARSEEHTSESSHVEISYAVFCLKKKNENLWPRPARTITLNPGTPQTDQDIS